MNTDSFTDEQLLGLINGTILDETEHAIDMFTGGSTQVTTTHNNKVTNYKLHLFFGYNENRNPVTYTEEINKEEYFIWTKAIMLKVESLQFNNTGSSFDKLNSRMNKGKEVVGKEVVGIGKERKAVVTTSYEEKKFTFKLTQNTQYENLSEEYKTKLYEYANDNNMVEAMIDNHTSKGKGFKDWSAAFRTWKRNDVKFNKVASSFKGKEPEVGSIAWRMKQDQEVIDVSA